MGMRVKAKWADELKPDHTLDQVVRTDRRTRRRLRALQGLPLMRDVADRRRSRTSAVAKDAEHNEVEMLVPGHARRRSRESGIPTARTSASLLGQPRLPAGRAVRVRDGARRGRRVAADPREPRRDGRGVGALRGVGRDPDRRGRQRARLRLRQVVAGRPARGHDAADRPVLRRAAVAVDGRPRRAAGARVPRGERPRRSATSPRSRPASQRNAPVNPHAVRKGDTTADAVLAQPVTHDPLRDADIAPDHRRHRRGRDRGRRPRPLGVRAPGVDPRHRAPHRGARPRRARPHRSRSRHALAARGRRVPAARSTSPSCTRSSATRS